MDPNKIIKPGTVETAWITPDGSYITTDPAEAKKNAATHQVSASKATYADGRRQWIVYTGADRSLAEGTYSPAGPGAGYDEDTQRAWQQQQSAAQRETAQAERKVTRTYTGTDPSTGRPATITEYESGPPKYDEIKPAAAADKPTTVATSTTEPYIVQTMPDGTIKTSPNPNYQGPKPDKPHVTTHQGNLVSIDPSTNKVTVLARGIPDVKTAVVDGVLYERGADNTWKPVAGDKKPDRVTAGDRIYERDPSTGQYVDKTPKPAAESQGPALPVLVLGQTQSALRTYKDQLNQQVAAGIITPTVAKQRWEEAKELGTFAIKEAQIFSHDEESRRNADTNLRTNAMSNAQSGFNSALDFVTKLAPTLKEGSTAGGEAFAAILGLQQLHAKRMGAYDTPYSGAGAPRSAEARGIDAATASAVGTTTSTIGNLLNQPAAADREYNTDPSTWQGRPADAQAAAADAQAAAAGPAPSAAPPAAVPAQAPAVPVAPAQAAAPVVPAVDPSRFNGEPGGNPIVPVDLPGELGQPGDPGYVAPPVGTGGGNVQMAPPSDDFAALAMFGQPQAPAIGPVLASPDPGPDMMPAARAARIAATVPWRISDEDWEWASQNGLLEDARRIPGQVA